MIVPFVISLDEELERSEIDGWPVGRRVDVVVVTVAGDKALVVAGNI